MAEEHGGQPVWVKVTGEGDDGDGGLPFNQEVRHYRRMLALWDDCNARDRAVSSVQGEATSLSISLS